MTAPAHRVFVWSTMPAAEVERWHHAWGAAVEPELAELVLGAHVVAVGGTLTLDQVVAELPVTWLPAERPTELGEAAWRRLQFRAHTHRRTTRVRFAALGAFGAGYATAVGTTNAAFRDLEPGRLIRVFRTDEILALIADVETYVDAEKYEIAGMPAPRELAPLLLGRAERPLLGAGGDGGMSAEGVWTLALQLTEFAGFACGPPGMVVAGVAHLIGALLARREHPISVAEIVKDAILDAEIEKAVSEISLIATSYAGYVNAALTEARTGELQRQTHWVRAFEDFYDKYSLPSGPLGKKIALLHDKVIQLVAIAEPRAGDVHHLRHAMSGLALGLAVYTNILIDLHQRDLALLSTDVAELAGADVEPWALPPGLELRLVQQKTTWLRDFLVPQVQHWGVALFEHHLSPKLEGWWKLRVARIRVQTYRPPAFRTIVPPQEQSVYDDGYDAFGGAERTVYRKVDTRMPNIGSTCCPEYAAHPDVQRAFDAHVAATRREFLHAVFGDSFEEANLGKMLTAWKNTIANVDSMTTIISEDQQDDIVAWKRRAAAAGRKPGAVLTGVKIVRAPAS